MHQFILQSEFKPTGDQPQAISSLLQGIEKGCHDQVLMGVTGSGKTYTIANIIQKLQIPTLVLSHNKTLAGQLYQEFRDFFPKNAVSYFVSYYDYYQPEAYIPQSNTYIEKETQINEEIDKLRLAATTNILTRKDTIVVASVSCIYNIGSPKEYGHFVLELKPGMSIARESIMKRLIELQYERGQFGFNRSTFRVRGDTIDIYPAYDDVSIRIVIKLDKLDQLVKLDPLTGKTIENLPAAVIYPAKHYMTDPKGYKKVFAQIRSDLDERVQFFKKNVKHIEAQRISERVTFDLEMIQEMGYVSGIENYSRYFDGRNPGDPPYTLLDYYKEAYGDDWLLVIDESHMSIPQIRGMYNGDRSRKQTLIDYGFRLPAAIDNRPLRFEEFVRLAPITIYASATPDEYEMGIAGQVVEQLIRPTGLVDPRVSVRAVAGQTDNLFSEIHARIARHERVLVTTLTKQMAEDLSKYLEEKGVKVHYLHADVLTLERSDILADLRSGTYDVIVGVNLLREGLDLPEVSLVAILDADREGFLRSRTSLIQTMGRAARHITGEVILYADVVTDSMKHAMEEVSRRREIQIAYNEKHGITPQGIDKPLRARIVEKVTEMPEEKNVESMTPQDRNAYSKKLTKLMRQASHDLDFELAAKIRDRIQKLESRII